MELIEIHLGRLAFWVQGVGGRDPCVIWLKMPTHLHLWGVGGVQIVIFQEGAAQLDLIKWWFRVTTIISQFYSSRCRRVGPLNSWSAEKRHPQPPSISALFPWRHLKHQISLQYRLSFTKSGKRPTQPFVEMWQPPSPQHLKKTLKNKLPEKTQFTFSDG